MQREMLQELLEQSKPIESVLVATADSKGVPHVGTAATVSLDFSRLVVEAWFCSQTLANLDENRTISVIVVSKHKANSIQVVGEVKKVEETAALDGYIPNEEKVHPVPQFKVRLKIQVTSVLKFELGPHYDVEIPQVLSVDNA